MFSQNKDESKLDWMYKEANSLVDREEYLLGRSIDKTLEQLNTEEKQKSSNQISVPKNHVEHECIPPSIRDYNKIQLIDQVDLAAKLQEDPLVAIRKREEETRKQFLQNPIQLKKLQKALKHQESKKRSKKKSKHLASDDDIDAKLVEKLNELKHNPLGLGIVPSSKKADKQNTVDTALIHKFNQLKKKLTEQDIKSILEGKETSSDTDSSDDGSAKARKKRKKKKKVVSDSDSAGESSKRKYKKKPKVIKRSDTDLSSDSSDDEEDSYRERRNKNKHVKQTDKYKHRNKNSESQKLDKTQRREMYSRERDQNRYRSKDAQDSYRRRQDRPRCDYRQREETKRRNSNNSDNEDLHLYRNPSHSPSPHKYTTSKKPGSSKPHSRSMKSEEYTKKKKSKNADKHRTRNSSNESESDKSDREVSATKKNWGLVTHDGKKIALHKKEAGTAEKKKTTDILPAKPIVKSRKTLTEEEKEEKRREMLDNVAWRDIERAKNVRKYKEQDAKESKITDFDHDFIYKELLKASSTSSIESRIKSNVNNIQRSASHMEKNFSRRN